MMTSNTIKSVLSPGGGLLSALAVLLLLAPFSARAQDETADAEALAEVTVRITHRIYPAFAETLSVVTDTQSQIGDTEFSFEVVDFVADFGIKPDGTVVSRSATTYNPAVQVVILEEGEEVDRHWAFFGTGKPHYRRDSMLAFEILSFRISDEVFTRPVPRKESAQ